MNQYVMNEQIAAWFEPTRKKLKRSFERSEGLRLLLLVLVNLSGCVLVLSPLITLAASCATAVYLLNHIQGPLDWFIVEVLCAISLFSGYLSLQLYRTRPASPGGVALDETQAPELFSMLERRVSHFRARPIAATVLTPQAELRIRATPRWPLPVFHTYTLCVGAPILFFVSPEQFRLALAGTIAATARTQRNLSGWAIQASEDWPAITETLETYPSLIARLLIKPVGRIADASAALSSDLRAARQQSESRWVLENTDESTAVEYLSNIVVAESFLARQYWPMINKAAERCPTPVVKPFSHFELLLGKTLNQSSAKRWLLQAQSISNDTRQKRLRELLACLGIDVLHWTGIPEKNAFHGIFSSSRILKDLDAHWQKLIEPEWDERHARFQQDKIRFDKLHERAQQQNLRGHSALRYVQLAARFLEAEQAVAVYRSTYKGNLDNANICYASGREMLQSGYDREGYQALQRAAELDNTLAHNAHALIDEHKRAWQSSNDERTIESRRSA